MASTLRFGPVGLTSGPQVVSRNSTPSSICSTSSVSVAPLLRGGCASRRSVLAGRPLAEDCNWTTR
eukprot:1152173-Pelagomonas_calceolata.AAC.7